MSADALTTRATVRSLVALDHGRAIRLCAAARGFSNTDLAQRTGLSVSFVCLGRRGLRPVAPPTLERIAAALGCSVGLLDALASDGPVDYAMVGRGVVGLMVLATVDAPSGADRQNVGLGGGSLMRGEPRRETGRGAART